LLLCALGSCQCNTVKAFAETNGIELKDLWLELEGDLDRDGLLDATARDGPQTQHMHLIFHMRSDAPGDAIRRLKAFIAQHWPEGDTLFNGVRIASSDIVVEPPQRFT
jgi:uncharacterized OsmC-like protein